MNSSNKRKVETNMKKTWSEAELKELAISNTAGGMEPKLPSDGDWTQLEDGKWWLPGKDKQDS